MDIFNSPSGIEIFYTKNNRHIMSLGLNTKAPYHFLFYSLSFGGAAFYSFIVSPLVFRELPREEFSNLQTKVFPTYFLGQTAAPLILGLLSPAKVCPFTAGLLALSTVAGGLNYFILLGKCKSIKEQRTKLVADKLDKDSNGEFTPEYQAITKQFGIYHGVSSLLNIVSIASLGVYGLVFAKRFR